jgi:hypothetical protein
MIDCVNFNLLAFLPGYKAVVYVSLIQVSRDIWFTWTGAALLVPEIPELDGVISPTQRHPPW